MPEQKKLTGADAMKAAGKTVVHVWLDPETLADVDAARQTRYGELPRTTILMTALNEFLDRENL